MNERIRELKKQATKIVETTDHCTGVSESRIEVDLEKFAELIVKECAKVADDGFASSNFGNGIAGHQLLKHFGVEE